MKYILLINLILLFNPLHAQEAPSSLSGFLTPSYSNGGGAPSYMDAYGYDDTSSPSSEYVAPSYSQLDFQQCPFMQRSEGVDTLIENSLNLLQQMEGEECQGIDNDVVAKLMGRYQELMPSRGQNDSYSGRHGNNGFSGTRKFESDSCVNFKMKYKLHFDTAISFVDKGLSIPMDNIFSQSCYVNSAPGEITEEEKDILYSCLDRALASKLQEKEIKCEGEIDEEMEVFYAESIMGVSQLIGSVLAGNCSGGTETLFDSLFNVAAEYVSLAAFSYPGLATGAITNILGPLFTKSSTPLERFMNNRNMEKIQCMHHSLEKAKCKTNTPSYSRWLQKRNDTNEGQCYLEEAMGIDSEVLVLAGFISDINLNRSSMASIQHYFDSIEKHNFFEKFAEVKTYLEENADEKSLDRLLALDNMMTQNQDAFGKIVGAYEAYKQGKKDGQNKFRLAKGIQENLKGLSEQSSLGLSKFFTLYSEVKAVKAMEKETDMDRYLALMRLKTFEGDRLADELTAPMNELMRQNDKKALKSVTAAFVSKTHEKFKRHLDDLHENLENDMKAFAKDKKFSDAEKEEIFTSMSSIIMTCQLNSSMYYYNKNGDTLDQMIAKGKYSSPYKKLCSHFEKCMNGKIDNQDNNLGEFNNFVCSNSYNFSMDYIRKGFEETGKVCGKSMESIYKDL